MRKADTKEADPEALALAALGWTLAEPARAQRLLAALLRFLEGHEPDLLACAQALDVPPARLAEARRRLEA